MTSNPAISTNHAKISTGLRDNRLCNKLVECKAKKWTTMSQVLQDVADMAIDFERSLWVLTPNIQSSIYFILQILVLLTVPTSQLQRNMQQPSNQQEKPKCWHCNGEHYKNELSDRPQTKFPPKYKSTKEKQHNLIKTYHKKFQDRRQINKLCTPAGDSSKEFNNLISEFENIILEDSYNSSV